MRSGIRIFISRYFRNLFPHIDPPFRRKSAWNSPDKCLHFVVLCSIVNEPLDCPSIAVLAFFILLHRQLYLPYRYIQAHGLASSTICAIRVFSRMRQLLREIPNEAGEWVSQWCLGINNWGERAEYVRKHADAHQNDDDANDRVLSKERDTETPKEQEEGNVHQSGYR